MFLYSLLVTLTFASLPNRISNLNKDLSASEQIYISPGMATVLEFPKPIIEVRIGDPNILRASISTVSSNELSLFVGAEVGTATNLIVRSDRRTYIFDVVPSRTSHQDFIKVSSAFGSPKFSGNSSLLVSKDLNTAEVGQPQNLVLVESAKLDGGQ